MPEAVRTFVKCGNFQIYHLEMSKMFDGISYLRTPIKYPEAKLNGAQSISYLRTASIAQVI